MIACKFFFSYARIDKSDQLDDFFFQLSDSVMKKTANKEHSLVAFRDTNNVDLGTQWTPQLDEAIQSSSICVCIYSPSFFDSDYCGREVSIFQARINEYRKIYKKAAPVILPVLWETPDIITIPHCLREIQYLHEEIHEDYAKKGLLTFSKLSRYRDPYLEFIDFLANKIVATAREHKLPPTKDSIKDIASAFTLRNENNNLQEENNNNKWSSATKTTAVIYAVGNSNEIQGVKTKTQGYGEKGEYWKPFYSEENDEIGIILQQVISEKKLHYVPCQFSENLAEMIREAEDNNCVAILVVDPWSVKLSKYKKPISVVNESLFINSAIAIIWNQGDEETVQQKDILNSNLYNSLFRLIDSNLFVHDIQTISQLKDTISIAIDKARTQLLKRGKIFQTIPSDTTSIPLLNANGVSNNG